MKKMKESSAMKKQIYIGIILAIALSLTGCAKVNETIGNKMLQKSGVLDDSNYQAYEQYATMGMLDSNGYYLEENEENTRNIPSGVCVTFSKNSSLEVQYYYDEACQIAIDGSECHLEPGESVYAVTAINEDIYSNTYEFSGFRVYEFDEKGKKTVSTSVAVKTLGEKYVITIPQEYEGNSISVEPVGEYRQRAIVLNDYYTDDRNQNHELSGKWLINDKECFGEKIEINPVIPYIISYEYDSNEYFFLSSSPGYYYLDNHDGVVIFNQREANDETKDYSVELHKYISVALVSDMKRTVKINGGSEQKLQPNEEITIDHLKYGDTVILETNRAWNALENERNLILTTTEPLSYGKYRYTLVVPEKDGKFVFNPQDYHYDNGTIAFKCFGQTVDSTIVLAKGSKIYYEQKNADAGYCLSGNSDEHYIVVENEEQTKKDLTAIHFTQKVMVNIQLPQPKVGGSIIYKINGKTILGTTINTYSGTEITVKYKPWQGWTSKIVEEKIYTVGDGKNQTVNVEGIKIDEIFKEDEEHKPKLTLGLEKSVGKAMQFTLTASGYSMDVESYGGGWKVTDIVNKDAETYNIISNKEYIVNGQKVGTEQPIRISISNKAIQAGTAVRMTITLTDSNKKKSTEVRYIDDLSNAIEPIYIYSPGTNGNSKVWYSSIEITIGVINIEKYIPTTPGKNTRISVRKDTTNVVMASGTLIEGSQNVVVTISPNSGYYITGKNVTNGVYSEKMSFSDYLKNIKSIISSHPAEKYYEIKLDASDSFAVYTYKLDGSVVSGSIKAKEGQKLELSYEITDPTYQLTEARGGIPIVGWFSTKLKASGEITVSAILDGTVVTKSNFDIEVKKGG